VRGQRPLRTRDGIDTGLRARVAFSGRGSPDREVRHAYGWIRRAFPKGLIRVIKLRRRVPIIRIIKNRIRFAPAHRNENPFPPRHPSAGPSQLSAQVRLDPARVRPVGRSFAGADLRQPARGHDGGRARDCRPDALRRGLRRRSADAAAPRAERGRAGRQQGDDPAARSQGRRNRRRHREAGCRDRSGADVAAAAGRLAGNARRAAAHSGGCDADDGAAELQGPHGNDCASAALDRRSGWRVGFVAGSGFGDLQPDRTAADLAARAE